MDINLIENIIKNLNNKEKIDSKEELETLITDLHRIKNDIFDLNNKNEELNNRFGLFWKEVPEKMIKNISENEIVYGKSLYSFVTKIKNGEGRTIKANINGEEVKLTRQSDSYLFKDSNKNEFLIYSDSLYKFSRETQEEYIPVLKEKGGDFFVGENEDNILIEGDNYYALQMLQYTHKEKIDVIYIDPPYNTGNKDFKYNDKFVKTEDGERHSAWLSFMNKRLLLAKEILKNSGVLIISIDENEQANLELLLSKHFGEKNIIGCFPTIMNFKGNQNSKHFAGCHEFTFFVAKNIDSIKINELRTKEKEELKKWEKDDFGLFKKGRSILSSNHPTRYSRPFLYFPVLIKDDKLYMISELEYNKIYNKESESFNDLFVEKLKEKYEKEGYCFLLPLGAKNQKLLWDWGFNGKFITEKNNILLSKNKNGKYSLFKKQRPLNGEVPTYKQKSLFYAPEYSSGTGRNDLKVFGFENITITPKPLSLLKDLILLATNKKATIVDFFAGSGTAGQAVWDLNKEDNGNRKFILCTNNENNICEDVTFERLKRANEKYEYNESLKYLTINHVSEKVLRKEDNRGQFETLKEIVNLKYNSFKIIEENEEWYVNENIAILKDFDYLEEFKQKFSNHEYLGLVTNEEAEWNIFKEKLISIKKEDNLTQFSSSYMNEIRKVIKGQC